MNVHAILALLVVAPPCVWSWCPPGTFECRRRCLAEEYVCDGVPNCWVPFSDGDESPDTCKGKCKPGASFCSKLGRCIPDWMECANARVFANFPYVDCGLEVHRLNQARYYCNGRTECTDGRDERGCDSPERCTRTAFFCDGKCRPYDWLCDGYRDCKDMDDEANCTYSNITETSTDATEITTSTDATETTTKLTLLERVVDSVLELIHEMVKM